MNKEQKIQLLKNFRRDGLEVCQMKLAREILADSPKEFSVLIILGSALSALERHAEAITTISDAIRVATDAQKYEAYVTMAFVYHQKGEFSISENWYEKAFLQHEPRPVDQEFYASCLMKKGEYQNAINLLNRIADTKVTKFYALGLAYRASERYEQALECFQKALSVDDDYDIAKEAIEDILKATVTPYA